MGLFSSDFSFAVSSANLLNNLLNKCLGSASFLCSAFTWMQIHMSLAFAGNWLHLTLMGWDKKPYRHFPGLPTRELSAPKSIILPPTCRLVLAGELKFLQTWRRNISCWKSLPKLNLLVAPDGSNLGTVPVGSSFHHQPDSHLYFKQLFSLPVTCLLVNYGEEEDSPWSLGLSGICTLLVFLCKTVFADGKGWQTLAGCMPKASPGRAAMGRTKLTAHTQDVNRTKSLVEKWQYLNLVMHWEEVNVSSCVFSYQVYISELQKA